MGLFHNKLKLILTLILSVFLMTCSKHSETSSSGSGSKSPVSSQALGSDCTSGACCDKFHYFRSSEMVCDFILGTKCTGTSATCPTYSLPTGVQDFPSKVIIGPDGKPVTCLNDSSPIAPPTPGPGGSPLAGPPTSVYNSVYNSSSPFLPKAYPGDFRKFSITFQNIGTAPWQYSDGIYLGGGVYDLVNHSILGLKSVPMKPGEVVAGTTFDINGNPHYGGMATFDVSINLPDHDGQYLYYFKLYRYQGSCMFLPNTDPLYCDPYFGNYFPITFYVETPPPPPPNTCDPNVGSCGTDGEKQGPN